MKFFNTTRHDKAELELLYIVVKGRGFQFSQCTALNNAGATLLYLVWPNVVEDPVFDGLGHLKRENIVLTEVYRTKKLL